MVCGRPATAQYVIRMAGSAGLLTAKVGLSARLPFRMVGSGRIVPAAEKFVGPIGQLLANAPD